MTAVFFANKKGGSSKAIDYLLNEREQQGTARVLKGDPKLTREIINSIKYKQKTTVGCLSFEEKNISEDMKYQLIEDFEKHLLPGMQDRYNILWVEHTDKGRLELNFVIPKIDLISQKSLNPYYHKADLPRVEKWQDLQNLKYNFSSPKDPSKKRTLQTNSKEIYLSKDYEQLDKLLHNLTQDGKINNREQLIELLQSNQIQVTRKGKDYLSIKLPDSKKAKKFKGSIYDEQFKSITAIRGISETAREEIKQYNRRDIQRECERVAGELESYTQDKERKLRKIYFHIREKDINQYGKIERINPTNARKEITNNRENDRGQAGEREQIKNDINSDSINHSNSNSSIRDNILQHRKPIQREAISNTLLLDDKPQQRAVNDSIRATANERISTRESTQYRDYRKTRNARIQLLEELTATAKNIRKQSLSNSREFQEQHRAIAPRISNDDERREEYLLGKARENIRAYSIFQGIARGITERFREVGAKIIEIGNRFNDFFQGDKLESESNLRQVERIREIRETRKQKAHRNRGYER